MTMTTISSLIRTCRSNSGRLLVLLMIYCFWSITTVQSGANNDKGSVECPVDNAWGGETSSTKKTTRIIPASRINDDYCDCPLTGADEPNTSACAGSLDWPGVVVADQQKEVTFPCPQQPKLKLAASKVNDGICDCCDGADETATTNSNHVGVVVCKDNCDSILADERRQRELLKTTFTKGNQRRLQELSKWQTFKTETLQKISKTKTDLDVVQQQATTTVELYEKAQLQWIRQRLNKVASRVSAMATTSQEQSSTSVAVEFPNADAATAAQLAQLQGMLEPLSISELEWFIVHACQVAGEMTTMPSSSSSEFEPTRAAKKKVDKTCIPLRLAGLDSAIFWQAETYKFVHVDSTATTTSSSSAAASNKSSSSDQGGDNADDENEGRLLQEEEQLRELADLLQYNMQAQETNDPILWHAKTLPKKGSSGSSSRSKRRRLSEADWEPDEYDDDIEEAEEEDMDREYPPDDDYVMPEEEEDAIREDDDIVSESRHQRRRRHNSKFSSSSSSSFSDDNVDANKRDEMKSLIQNQSFSKSRVLFLERSELLLNKINQITEQQEDEQANKKNTEEGAGEEQNATENDENKEESKNNATEKDEAAVAAAAATEDEKLSSLSFDPMVLPMTKNQLVKRREAIERGLDYAVSSRVLLDSLRQAVLGENDAKEQDDGEKAVKETDKVIDEEALKRQKKHLESLAMMTINHGKLSALQLWQLYQSVIPELSSSSSEKEDPAEESCQAPWAGSCPPRSIKRIVANGVQLSLPPKPIFEIAQAFCEGSLSSSSSPESSSSAYRPELACANPAEIPETVSDGLFGYVSVYPRDEETDLMSKVFEGLSLGGKSTERTELTELEKEKERLENEKSQLKEDLDSLIQSIGGEDDDDDKDSKFGLDGELHAIRDSCFSVDAGKYTYELCMFKSANQRDLGQKHGGTHLGSFQGVSIDEDDGQRLWKWDRGAKCWNGPARSATAHVTCGEDTKVLSANEPDTCRYVFEVESYIACDEEFRIQHGL